MGFFSEIGAIFSKNHAAASQAAESAERVLVSEASTVGKMAAKAGGFFGDKTGSMLGALGKTKTLVKVGALGAVVAGGAAAYGLANQKRVTAESVADDPLAPEQVGEVSAPVSEDPQLNTLMGQEPVTDGQWANTVRGGGGPEGPEKLANAPVPDGAFDEVSVPVRG